MKDGDKVISLRGGAIESPNQPNKRVIETLEAFLKRAKAGELNGLAITATQVNGFVRNAWCCSDRGFSLLGALSILQHEMTCGTCQTVPNVPNDGE